MFAMALDTKNNEKNQSLVISNHDAVSMILSLACSYTPSISSKGRACISRVCITALQDMLSLSAANLVHLWSLNATSRLLEIRTSWATSWSTPPDESFPEFQQMLPRLDSLLLYIAVLEQDGLVYETYCKMFRDMNKVEVKQRHCKNSSIRVLSVLVRLLEHHVASNTGPASSVTSLISPSSSSSVSSLSNDAVFPLFDSVSFLLPHLNLCINNKQSELTLRIGTCSLSTLERKARKCLPPPSPLFLVCLASLDSLDTHTHT